MNTRTRWFLFWLCGLVALLAFGAWRTVEARQQAESRGIELATRQTNLPYKLPMAGVNVELTQYEDITAELDQIADLGFFWLRQPFLWSEIEPIQGEYDWAKYDRIVSSVASYDGQLQLVAVLDGTPSWARHSDAPDHPFAPPASPAAYGDFARALAERYGETIHYYQIWDEPNIEEHWGNLNPRPALYLAMLDAAYKGIHGVDPQAMVIIAALAPTVETGPDNINDPAYLRAIYELGGRDSFDAAAGKPYGFDRSPLDRTVDVNVTNFSRLILLREEMILQGDGTKPLWGSNWGWNSLPEDWNHRPSIWGQVNFTTRQDYTKLGYERALTEWAWAGGMILQHWQPAAPQDDPIQGFAIAPTAPQWAGIIPQPKVMTTGLYPAVNPYAVYAGDWTFSDLGADAGAEAEQNTITIPFEGSEFAIQVRRGNYLAYLGVTIDGEPANALPRRSDGEAFISLTSATREPAIDLILVAEDLPSGQHTAVITHRPELGDDQFPIVAFAVATAPQTNQTPLRVAQMLFGIALLSLVGIGWRLPWGNIRLPSSATLRNIGDYLLGLFFSAVVMVGMLLTFQETLSAALKRDLPTVITALASSAILYYAPATWIALIGLCLTGVVIFSRPWVGVLQILFWAIFFTTTIDPFFRAIFVVEALLGITLAATFARMLYNHAQTNSRPNLSTIQLNPLDWCMVGLVILGLISLTWVDFFSQALREWRVMLLQPALFYLLIRLLKPDRRDLAFLVEALLVTGFMLSAIGLLFYVTKQNVVIAEGGARRLLSVYGSPNAVGLVLGRCLPFALAYLLLPVTQWRKILAGVAGLTMLVALALTQSVGAILLGLPVGIAVVVIGWKGKQAFPILAGLAVVGLIALLPLSQAIPRLRQITDIQNNTTVFRVNLWRSSRQLIEEHPLTGVGLDQFLYQYRSRYILPEAWEDPDLSHPHNIILDYWVRLGLGGLGLAMALQFFFWRQAFLSYHYNRTSDALRLALVIGAMGAMGASLAHGLVDMGHFNINLSYLFALLLALVIHSAPHPAENSASYPNISQPLAES